MCTKGYRGNTVVPYGRVVVGVMSYLVFGRNPPKRINYPRETPFWQNLQAITMRKIESTQVELGGAFIGDIVIDAKSRDDIPALLLGL